MLGEVTRIFNVVRLEFFEVSHELDWTFVKTRCFSMVSINNVYHNIIIGKYSSIELKLKCIWVFHKVISFPIIKSK